MAPVLSTGMLVGVSTAPAWMPQPLMAPHKAAVFLHLVFTRPLFKWVVFADVARTAAPSSQRAGVATGFVILLSQPLT